MRVCAPKTAYLLLIILLACYISAFADWSPPIPISQAGDCWDPQIIASGDTLHVVYENTGAGYDKVSYVRSTDAGQSWSTPVRLTERRGHTFYPRIMQNGQQLMVLWKQEFNTGYYIYNVGYAISNNGGASWDSAQYIFDQNWMGMQNMAAAGTGPNIDVIMGAQVAYDFIYYSVRSTNFGISWSDTDRVFSCYQSGRPNIAESNSGVHFVWFGSFVADTTWEVYYTRSLNGGLIWSQNLLLSTPDQHGSEMSAISLNESGEVSIAWMDGKYSPYMLTGDILIRIMGQHGVPKSRPRLTITLGLRISLSVVIRFTLPTRMKAMAGFMPQSNMSEASMAGLPGASHIGLTAWSTIVQKIRP